MLETPRLRLIPIAAEHFDSLAAMYADPEVSRFLHGEPLDRAESWPRLALNLGHWILRGYGNFACIEKTSGTFVGLCGPWYPEGWPALEVGYAFLREFGAAVTRRRPRARARGTRTTSCARRK